MIIDAHAHACGELYNIDGILNYLTNNKLDMIVLCPGEINCVKNRKIPMISDIMQSSHLGYGFNKVIRIATGISGVAKHIQKQNQSIACLAKSYPDKIIQAFWINPLEDNYIQEVESNYAIHNFSVLKMHQCWHNFDVLQNEVETIVEWSISKHMPIFIHLLSKEQCIKFATLANRFQKAVFIVGHMIGFDDIVVNSTSENIFFDISAPFLIPFTTLEKALQIVGSDRLILGSDTPYGESNIRINIDRIERLGLTAYQQENVMANNFIQLTRCSTKKQNEG